MTSAPHAAGARLRLDRRENILASTSRRSLVAALAAAPFVNLFSGLIHRANASPPRAVPPMNDDQDYDVSVGDPTRGAARLDLPSLEAALQAAREASPDRPFRIWLGEGRHNGQFHIDRARVELHGRGKDKTVLYFDAAAGHTAPDGRPYGTFRTGCVQVTAPDVVLRGLSILNTFDAPAEMRRPGGMRADEGGSQQAIALSLGRGADRSLVIDCDLASHQDTLFCAEGRALFVDCLIQGSYDFIFGGAAARFERCEVRSLPRLDPVQGYVCAPNTPEAQPHGLVFEHCRLTAAPDVPDASVFLGRPWGATTQVGGRRVRAQGMTAFLACEMGAHIAPGGWTRMWFTAADGSAAWFEPEFARFSEHRNHGPGAVGQTLATPSPRRGVELTAAQAEGLTRLAMFDDWRPHP